MHAVYQVCVFGRCLIMYIDTIVVGMEYQYYSATASVVLSYSVLVQVPVH